MGTVTMPGARPAPLRGPPPCPQRGRFGAASPAALMAGLLVAGGAVGLAMLLDGAAPAAARTPRCVTPQADGDPSAAPAATLGRVTESGRPLAHRPPPPAPPSAPQALLPEHARHLKLLDLATNAFRFRGRVTEIVESVPLGCDVETGQARRLGHEAICATLVSRERPVAGARLRVRWSGPGEPHRNPRVDGALVTDAEGRFDLVVEAGRTLRLDAVAAGRSSSLVASGHPAGDVCETELQFPAWRGYVGRVVDERGRGLAGVEVGPGSIRGRFVFGTSRCGLGRPLAACGRHLPPSWPEVGTVVTDGGGWFRLPTLRRGSHGLVAARTGWLPRRVDAEMPVPHAWSAVTIRLERAATLSGRVVTENGRPVRGAAVWVEGPRRPHPSWGEEPGDARTDRHGRFVLDGFEPGQLYTLRAGKPGDPALQDAALEALSVPRRGVVLVLRREGSRSPVVAGR